MKVTKIPGLGRFGIFIDDLDFTNLSDEEWMEIGKLHLESLVTIIRNVKLTPSEYENWINKWGSSKYVHDFKLQKKYNLNSVTLFDILDNDVVNGIKVDEEDRAWLIRVSKILAIDDTKSLSTNVLRVSGLKDKEGDPIGMFAEGELLWHSNESGNLSFSPGVALYGAQGVVGSATGFLTTTDWYEDQSESFRSELDEMILCHAFTPGRINPGLRADQDDLMYRNMCPAPIELPLVIQSPIGIKGLHYSVNTINTVKGLDSKESQKIFDRINKTLFVEKYIYDHWYQQDNDICLFDNSITLHRRLGGITSRLCYRMQFEYNKLVPADAPRYLQEPYISMYKEESLAINKWLGVI